jgi:allantoicase
MNPLTEFVDLAAESIGGEALIASDEFFAPKENLLKPGRGVFIEDRYTARGKWMDGWESRRKRVPGYDWCIIKLGLPGVIRGFDVDTNHFRGNYPEACSIEACTAPKDVTVEQLLEDAGAWETILERSTLQGHSQNFFTIESERRFTHLRLNIYPDGGVARLRVYGEVVPDWKWLTHFYGHRIDLATVEHGGVVSACNDMFFGSRHNLIMPGRSINMGGGWETQRKRDLPGSDWVIIKLGTEGCLESLEVDTNHFKGNFPESFMLQGCYAKDESIQRLTDSSWGWQDIFPRTKLKAHTRHFFVDHIIKHGALTHVRLVIYPDGGISRLRLYGQVSPKGFDDAGLRRLNSLTEKSALVELKSCCGSTAWTEQMVASRPFANVESYYERADEIWNALEAKDWLEAFRAHPKIGGKSAADKSTELSQSWSNGEQAGMTSAGKDVHDALFEVNEAYEQRFGHIYIVCATGKTGEQMLEIARSRLSNEADKELRIAAEEQRKITRIRLEKLFRP